MVLFDEDPVSLIRETTNQFHIAPDRDSLSRIGGSLTTLDTARAARLAAGQGSLRALARRLNGLAEGRRWEEERHDAGGHAARMLRMDSDKFRVAKEVANAQIEQERLEGELAGLRAQADGLEREGVEGPPPRGARAIRAGEAEDEVVLKLHLYRSLGITATHDADTRAYTRAVVRRRADSSAGAQATADVTVIEMDPMQGGGPHASILWDAM